jgi:hypothetical protein
MHRDRFTFTFQLTHVFQLLMLHYDRCAKYYGSTSGQGMYGASSDEEKRLTMMLFSNIFDSLSKMVSYKFNSRVNFAHLVLQVILNLFDDN